VGFGGVEAFGNGRFVGKRAIAEFTDLPGTMIEGKQHNSF